MNKPDFYKKMFYNKQIVAVASEVSLKRTYAGFAGKTRVGEEIKFSIEILDFVDDADCKISSFSNNFWFRTPHGINSKFYESAKQLEKSVRLSLVKRGFQFVRWEDQPAFA